MREPEYSCLADEYYDAKAHPTCANFRELSVRFISNAMPLLDIARLNVLEVGAGSSIVAPLMRSHAISLKKLTLSDDSPEMLQHSDIWKTHGASVVVANAEDLPFDSNSFDVVVSSLGDPYNTTTFWNECSRVCANNGKVLFTTPSHQWANCFRPHNMSNIAEFLKADGEYVHVSSHIYDVEQQSELMNKSGISVRSITYFQEVDLSGEMSSKLSRPASCSFYPLISGYEGEVRKAA